MSKEMHKAVAAKELASQEPVKKADAKVPMKHIMQGTGNVIQYLNGSIKDAVLRKEFEDWLNHQAELAGKKFDIETASHTFTLGEFEQDNPANPEEYAVIYQLHYSILPPPPKEAFSPESAHRWSNSGLQAVYFLVQDDSGTIIQGKESPANAKNEKKYNKVDLNDKHLVVLDSYPTLH